MAPTAQNQADLNKLEIKHTNQTVARVAKLAEGNRSELSKQATDNAALAGAVTGLAEHIKELREEVKYWKRMLIIGLIGLVSTLAGVIWALSRTTGG